MALEEVSSAKCFGGLQKVFKHKRSAALSLRIHLLTLNCLDLGSV